MRASIAIEPDGGLFEYRPRAAKWSSGVVELIFELDGDGIRTALKADSVKYTLGEWAFTFSDEQAAFFRSLLLDGAPRSDDAAPSEPTAPGDEKAAEEKATEEKPAVKNDAEDDEKEMEEAAAG